MNQQVSLIVSFCMGLFCGQLIGYVLAYRRLKGEYEKTQK